MRYKIFVSNGYDYEDFYFEDKRKADLLFNMAVDSEMFSYVELSECIDECFIKREWCSEESDTE